MDRSESMEPRLTVAWQPSIEYTAEYVDRIVSSVYPMPVEVVQEHRWPGWWCKMGLFDPRIEGDVFYCDLDTVIVGDVSHLAKAGRTTMLKDFFFPARPASGLMYLTAADRARVWKRWIENPDRWMRQFKGISGGGDGAFLATILEPRFWQDDYPGEVCSFKVDCQKEPPGRAKVICYHGNPRPHETNWADRDSRRWSFGVPASALHCPR